MRKEPKIIRPDLLCQPNIIKPLHGLNPRTILGQKRWDFQRYKAYAKNNDCCMSCGIHKSKAKYHKRMEAHEVYLVDFETHTYRLVEIVPLCHSCHNYIHDWRLSILARKGEISMKRYNAIMRHGDTILKENGLQRGSVMYQMCKWDYTLWEPENNWTRADRWLMIEGIKYYTKFKTYMDWCNFYHR